MIEKSYKMYNVVMNENQNGFRNLPKSVQFQLMNLLAWMWCIIFCLGFASYAYFGTLVVMHTLVITGALFTAGMFNKAEKH